MNMNYAGTDGKTGCCSKVYPACQIVMAVHYFVPRTSHFRAKGPNECSLVPDSYGRMQNASAQCDGFIVQFPLSGQGTVERPIEVAPLAVGVPQHTHEPVFDGATVEAFDNMKSAHWVPISLLDRFDVEALPFVLRVIKNTWQTVNVLPVFGTVHFRKSHGREHLFHRLPIVQKLVLVSLSKD